MSLSITAAWLYSWIRFRLHVHRAWLPPRLLEDDFGFGLTLRANGRRTSFRFADQPLPFRFRERLNALALDVRRIQYRGQSSSRFAARDFRFLHASPALRAHCWHADRFHDHLLLLDVGFDLIRFICLRLRFLGAST